MSDLNICSNEKLVFKYNDEWELDDNPSNQNPDCIATLSYTDGSLLNVIAFPSELESLDLFKNLIDASLTENNGEIVSSDIANIGKFSTIQVHSKISIPEISFEMFTVVFLEDGFLYIFEYRTLDDDTVSKFMNIITTVEFVKRVDYC